jgi:hypothetical protein
MQATSAAQQTIRPKASAARRSVALDAFRGFIMLMAVSDGFGLAEVAKHNPAFLGIAGQFDHRPWEWIAIWDLIHRLSCLWWASPCCLRWPGAGSRERLAVGFSKTWQRAACDWSQ